MIKSFRDKDSAELYAGERVPKYESVRASAERKLRLLEASDNIQSLRLPSNRLEKLKGDREGQYGIRINAQWRICFEWHEDGAHNVEIVD